MNAYERHRTELTAELHSNANTGLTAAAVAEKQQIHGKNRLEEQKPEGIFKKILHNLRDVSTIILLIAAALALVMGFQHDDGYIEFAVIMGIVILNMILAITQERSAEKSLAALKNLNSPTSLVLRGGVQQEIASEELVPGDILLLKSGDMVSADARLLESVDFAVDESALTGESLPAQKSAEAKLTGKVAVADQINMVFSGCLVTAGRTKALVVATGMQTQMGRIAAYLNNTQKLKTPLQNRIDNIGKVVSFIAVAAALLMVVLGLLRGANFWDMTIVAISLGVAAVPETLALIVTLMLSHGVTEMVKKNALIRKLQAVETLGSTSIICTDKTGTLTQNRMAIKRLWLESGDPFQDDSDFTTEQLALLQRFALANNAASPTEAAVLHLLQKKGIEKGDLDAQYPRVAEISFSSERKMMTTVHRAPQGGYLVLTSGAFDRVPFIAAAPSTIEKRNSIHDAFAGQALRILALGSKYIETLPENLEELETDLHFEGIIGIIDPPRPECAAAVAAAKNAGIRTVMITGDHAVTAGAIAKQVGILSAGDKVLTGLELAEMSDEELIESVAQYAVYARVSPEDKIRIVEAWQEHSEVVAMTGDGVNDAPALKAADVGIAMGIAGTEVAKSAADMVLTDDNFSTIVAAVRRGRNVFSNIRKLVYFLLVCNFSEIVIMLGAQLFGWGMPLTPIMLLLINVLGDGIPGMRLAYERSDPRIMQRKPIGRKESLFSGLQFVITKQIIAFVAVAWIGFYIGCNVPLSAAHAPTLLLGQTLCFLIVGWTSILHVFTVRSRQSMFKRTIRDNPQILYAALGMIALFALLVLISPLHNIFGVTSIGLYHWLLAIGLSLVPTITAEIGKLIQNHMETRRHKRRLLRHVITEE